MKSSLWLQNFKCSLGFHSKIRVASGEYYDHYKQGVAFWEDRWCSLCYKPIGNKITFRKMSENDWVEFRNQLDSLL